MNSNHRVLLVVSDVYAKRTVTADRETLARARAVDLVAADNVTVDTAWQAGLQSDIHAVIFVIDSNKCLVSTAERNLMVAIVPPVLNLLTVGNVSKLGHVVDLSPTMLTNPTVTASVITK